MAPEKVIIDTDPGCDDIMALMMALSASPEEMEVAMLSITYGNVPREACARNAVGMFKVIEQEMAWRKANGKDEGFATMRAKKPLVALAAEHPLEQTALEADYFHGADGLHDVHAALPHLSPADTWKSIFHDMPGVDDDCSEHTKLFTPSKAPSHKEMLRILRENPQDTVTIIAVGPMTTVAQAAAEDPETFLRVKEVVVMGGAVNVKGNVTPVAEFNTYADPVATARVFALTSMTPSATMPASTEASILPPYPEKLSRRLNLTLCPLDITEPHEIDKKFFAERFNVLVQSGSPLAQWTAHILGGVFKKIESILGEGTEAGLSMHDPLTVWYVLTRADSKWKVTVEDIRVETTGQWSKGMHIVDNRAKLRPAEAALQASADPLNDPEVAKLDFVPGDTMAWLSVLKRNQVNRIIASPGETIFKQVWADKVFGKI